MAEITYVHSTLLLDASACMNLMVRCRLTLTRVVRPCPAMSSDCASLWSNLEVIGLSDDFEVRILKILLKISR